MKFVKVIYFDENSVADFIQIIAGGDLKKTTEFLTSVSTEAKAGADAEAGINTETKGLPKLFSFLSGIKLSASVKAETDASYKKDRIVKNILENTLLADFIDLFENDKHGNQRYSGIKIFENLSVYPEYNSFSFLMLAAPFFTMMEGNVSIPSSDGNTFRLDVSKMEEAIKKGRGYYEFIAEYDGNEIILRFNNSAFRNNYTMSDLPKMQLTFFAVHVGKTNKNKLKIEKEFEFGTKNFSRVCYGDASGAQENDIVELEVFDVVLAGVVEN